MLSACLVWLCLNCLATLPPNGGVLELQVVKWANRLPPVAQTPSQEAVIIGVVQFRHQGRCRYCAAQQSPLNNVRKMTPGLQTGRQGFASIQLEYINGGGAFGHHGFEWLQVNLRIHQRGGQQVDRVRIHATRQQPRDILGLIGGEMSGQHGDVLDMDELSGLPQSKSSTRRASELDKNLFNQLI
jgi:hypothetical protein